ncbi:glycosyltransferase family 2 protein [Ancylobacter sp.]|uniref:glycosyltransferase family 2 protein n=1 Tax=Ancylobacter sp. TaxID=1872567 RepID=UPI003D0F6F39
MLAELLDSIVAEGHADDVEVVVSDDASTDDTLVVAGRYSERIKHFNLISQPHNLGFDRNFLAVTAAARAPYIWLMGDDDLLEPGGLSRLLEMIERWPQAVGFTLGVIDYDVTMTTPIGIRGTPPTQLITGAKDLFLSMADLLGFMSTLVVKRSLWDQAAKDPQVQSVNNCYVQVIIAGKIIGESGQWGVIQEPCVGFRTGNDQLLARYGWLDRLKIDARAYGEIADLLFPDDPETRARIIRRIFDTHIMARILNAKTMPETTMGTFTAAVFLARTYGDLPAYWTRALPILMAPKWSIRHARSFYKNYFKSSGAYRASNEFAKKA